MDSLSFEVNVGTFNSYSVVPVNIAVNGVFHTLLGEVIEEAIDDLEGTFLSFQRKPLEETLPERFELFRNIYLDDSKIDRFRRGSLEIYGDLTYRNLLRDHRASLNIRWSRGTASKSYQLNCLTEIVPRGTPYFRFGRLVRSIFSVHFVDLLGENHVCAYRFWICETISKDLGGRTGFRARMNTFSNE